MNKRETLLHMVKAGEINPKRALNMLKCWLSFKFRSPKLAGLPFAIMIEPTNFCNLKCPLCPTGNGSLAVPRGYMSLENFKKIIDEIGDTLVHIALWNFGESLLNKDVYEMIKYAKQKKIFIRISTNGLFFGPAPNVEENLERLLSSNLDDFIFAIDGASQETYEKYRVGGNLKKIFEHVKKAVEIKRKIGSKTFIEIQMIVMKHNEHELNKMEEIAKEIGVDKLTFKTVSFQVDKSGKVEQRFDVFLPSNEAYSRYKKIQDKVIRKDDALNECERTWYSMVINWDGDVTACCFDPNREYNLGNVFKDGGFKAVWNNQKYVNFRKRILTDKQSIPMCKNCAGKLSPLNLN